LVSRSRTFDAWLEKRGFIEIARSQLRITNRQGLEAAECEGYRIVKASLDLATL
jgi:hypothetical protein